MYYYDEDTGEFIEEGGSEYVAANNSDNSDNSGTGYMDSVAQWAASNNLPSNADGSINWAAVDAADTFGLGTASGDSGGSEDFAKIISNLQNSLGTKAFNAIKTAYTKPGGGTDWRAIAATAGGLYGMYQTSQQQNQPKTGYQGGVPKYEMVREKVANTYDPDRRPGSTAQNYFTGTKYVAPADAAAARTTAKEEAVGLEALNRANPARQERTTLQAGAERKEAEVKPEVKPASSVIEELPVPKYASGGIATMARGRYLGGATDGMADKIPARIGEKQEAKLSHGEFVIPADVVGHLGNGNSEAGAQRLYAMMDKIRKARTGTTKQGKQINPDKFLA